MNSLFDSFLWFKSYGQGYFLGAIQSQTDRQEKKLPPPEFQSGGIKHSPCSIHDV